jgi:hypothetical protein
MVELPQVNPTCWTFIQEAAAGKPEARDHFARLYTPVIHACLRGQWRAPLYLQELPSATQEVLWECLKPEGALKRYDRSRCPSFRAFLRGVVGKVALRVETRIHARNREQSVNASVLENQPRVESSVSGRVDRKWANELLREAVQQQADRARHKGEAACKRVELLRLLFREGMSLPAIARLWQTEEHDVRREYAHARREFKVALLEVLHRRHPSSTAAMQQAFEELLETVGCRSPACRAPARGQVHDQNRLNRLGTR